MMIHNKLRIGALLLFLLLGCNDYLEVVPDNRTQINTPEKIKELLVSAYPDGLYAPFTEAMSDNAGDKAQGYRLDTQVISDAYFWKENFIGSGDDTPAFYWKACYAAIAAANKALEAIEAVGLSAETQPMKGEALMARAYAHFMLVNLWAKAYNPATAQSDLGIPIVKKPETVAFGKHKRASVKEVFDAIEEDLKVGIPLLDDDLFFSAARKYHFNIRAAHALAARFYLVKGEWQALITHANAVLSGDVSNQLKAWNGALGALPYDNIALAYASPSSPANLLIIEASSRWKRLFGIDRYGLTTSIKEKTFERKNPTGKEWAYKIFGEASALNIPKFYNDFFVTNRSAGIGFVYCPFVLFSLEEVLLNRAEAYAMSGNTTAALADLNTFYSRKIKGFTEPVTLADVDAFYSGSGASFLEPLKPFYALDPSVKPLLQAIVDARRVDFFFEGLRWFDIRRFHLPLEHRSGNSPYPALQIPLRLSGNSPRYTLQIPVDAVEAGLKKNPR